MRVEPVVPGLRATGGPVESKVDLGHTSNRDYHPGRPIVVRLLWLVVEAIIFLNPLFHSYRVKTFVLRAFGARVGKGLVIKPNVHIKHPWRLGLGENVWLGERAWIDNLAQVTIGSNAVVSQGAYICTGNHDWSDPGMGLIHRPIEVRPGAWIGAFSRIAPGVIVGTDSIVTLGSVLLRDAEARGIYRGNPAIRVGERQIRDTAPGD